MNSRAAVRLFRAFERKEEKGDQKMKRRIREAVTALVLAAVILLPIQGRSVSAESAGQGDASEKLSFTVDFGNKGYYRCPGGFETGMLFRQYPERMATFASGDDDYSESYQMDVDGDGTYDVAFVPRRYMMYGIPQLFAVPLPGNSLRKTVTLQGTEDNGFKTVTFKPVPSDVKKEYTIKVNGCKAYRTLPDRDGEKEYVVKAAPGTLINLEASQCPNGKYLKNWQSGNMEFPTDYEFTNFYKCFVMPAHDVTVNAVFAPQGTGTIHVGDFGFLKQEEIICLTEALQWDGFPGLIDLDGDGTYEMEINFQGDGTWVSAIPFRSVKDSFTLKQETPGLPYNRIVLKFDVSRNPYEIDMSGEIGNWGYYYPEKLREFLKAFEMADKPDYYDIDRDGNADFWVIENGQWSAALPLPTYSLGKSYPVPADDYLGAGKKITFVCKKTPEFHTVSLSVGEGGTAELFFCNSYWNIDIPYYEKMQPGASEDTIRLVNGDYTYPFRKLDGNQIIGRMYAFVKVTPAEGYELAKVTGVKNAEQEKGNLFVVEGDAEIAVTFEKLPEPTVTPTPTATPKPVVTVTEAPSPVPEESEKEPSEEGPDEPVKDSAEKEKKSVIPIILIILSAVVAASAAAGTVLYVRNRKRNDETEPKEGFSAPEEPSEENNS